METAKLKKFAQYARRSLIEQVSSKLAQVLKDESSERRELPNVVAKLESELKLKGKEQLIEQAAYTWFNRFCALRFMDVNLYNRIMVLSPLDGQFQPEILAEAKAGHIDDRVVNDKTKEKIFGLLNGSIKSRDGQSEAYRLLIVAVCNDYHRIMPYLFERIEDYMELLMPDDLLSGNSILAYTREAMTPETCESVECIGWLYQFYISEKKDQVFEGLKKNKKITPENIPAATQLFTPDWIVRYLVENSLGRLWMLNNPGSKVIEQMDYYIKPVEQETDFLRIRSPEEIRVCDPACGSGHMLTYAYDLLYAIYLDAGYDSIDIPELILTKNLYGIEIDERAAELAAFALSMKALKGNPNDESNNRRRFFRNPIKPNICRLERISFNDDELNEYFDFVGRDLFTQDLRATLKEFEEADNFGSLIQPTLKNAEDVRALLEAKDVSGQLFLGEIHKRVLQVLDQVDYLDQKYHVVVANPPYLNGNGMNARLKWYLNDNFTEFKSDLYAAFMCRTFQLSLKNGYAALITMHSWMFLMQSYAKMREKLFSSVLFEQLLHLGPNAFPSIGGEVVQVAAYIARNSFSEGHRPKCFRLIEGDSNTKAFNFLNEPTCFDVLTQNDFLKIPGAPFAYSASEKIFDAFEKLPTVAEIANPRIGLQTGDNETFLRLWFEVGGDKFCPPRVFPAGVEGAKWFPHNKGGEFRKWYGNCELVVNWGDNGAAIKADKSRRLSLGLIEKKNSECWNSDYYLREGATWTRMASGNLALRYHEAGTIFDTAAPTIFTENAVFFQLLGMLNSVVAKHFASLLNPTLSFQTGDLKRIPVMLPFENTRRPETISSAIAIAKSDWDTFETSWDFNTNPLLMPKYRLETFEKTYSAVRSHWDDLTKKMQQLEEENNRLFTNVYGLQTELKVEVPIENITLTCNPFYRYGGGKTQKQLEGLLLRDTVKEFISYSVGCMLCRYSIDKGGIIISSFNQTLADYLSEIPKPSFMPDVDNVIPMIDFDGEWFEDDISERFKEFLKVTFGDEHFSENLAFIEEAIGKGIKKYFVKDFYDDHVKRYQKRPIYWLFSSPKGAFNALIYMHRYRTDTVSIVLNDYLREFRTKLQARKESREQVAVSASASQKDKTDAIKAINKINKALDEVNDYERDILYPLAGQKIEIDLDDGVKANYPKFGKALKNITGLS
ncbi:BREX-1 system adenine-specific DNA-methyltransferase PglX [Acinetobacter nematophilus]|uniref:BREX-1 system adenine-specific DNA-methyltransferase PglX n=1 Tax=Acinetobacter nematophilus TaxID=2994642 RepID=UPI003AF93DC4